MHPYTYRLFMLSALWMIMGRTGVATKARNKWKELLSEHLEPDIIDKWFIADEDLRDPSNPEMDRKFEEAMKELFPKT